jgi:hypothetical protein
MDRRRGQRLTVSQVAKLAGTVPPPAASDTLNVAARQSLATTIGIEEPPRGFEQLRPLLHDSVSAVRLAAVWALGEMASPEMFRPATALTTDPSAVVRRAVAQAMYCVPHPDWRPLLSFSYRALRQAARIIFAGWRSPGSANAVHVARLGFDSSGDSSPSGGKARRPAKRGSHSTTFSSRRQ